MNALREGGHAACRDMKSKKEANDPLLREGWHAACRDMPIARGDGITACAEACERAGHRALVFGDLRDPDSEIAQRLREHGGEQIRADLGLNTGVRYQGIR